LADVKRSAEIVVIGAGVMGLATGAALARAGCDVVVVEQFGLDHDRGSSHGSVRIFKISYSGAEFVRLAQDSLRRWRALEAEAGDELLTTTGTLDIGGIVGRREALDECGAAFEMVSAGEVERRFGLRIDEHDEALFQPDGAVLHADRARKVLASSLDLVSDTAVESVAPRRSTVLLRTSAGELEARTVVVTAGAWVTKLLSTLGLQPDVVTVRETVAYFRLRDARQTTPLSEWRPEAGEVAYGIVGRDGVLKVGVSGSGKPDDPNERGRVDDDVVRRAADWASRRYALDDNAPIRAETCLYTNTADERFVIERHDRIVVGSACSGHGFKFAPTVGARLAELALEAAAS
jgi:sarcosine oxidase